MKKQIISLALVAVLTFTLSFPVSAASTTSESMPITDSITIHFESDSQSSRSTNNALAELASDDVMIFFEENELNSDFYIAWVAEQATAGADSVTIAVSRPVSTSATTRAALSDIEASRVVYAESYRKHIEGQTIQLTPGELLANLFNEVVTLVLDEYCQVFSSLGSLFGISDPISYFGSERAVIGKDYLEHEARSRLITKFVELYAPVQGTTQWYPWGYAESDYVEHIIDHYYKGSRNDTAISHQQYYTQHYYYEAALIRLTQNAYLVNSTYEEVAEDNAAAIGGYELFVRDIDETKFFEYDEYFQ